MVFKTKFIFWTSVDTHYIFVYVLILLKMYMIIFFIVCGLFHVVYIMSLSYINPTINPNLLINKLYCLWKSLDHVNLFHFLPRKDQNNPTVPDSADQRGSVCKLPGTVSGPTFRKRSDLCLLSCAWSQTVQPCLDSILK